MNTIPKTISDKLAVRLTTLLLGAAQRVRVQRLAYTDEATVLLDDFAIRKFLESYLGSAATAEICAQLILHYRNIQDEMRVAHAAADAPYAATPKMERQREEAEPEVKIPPDVPASFDAPMCGNCTYARIPLKDQGKSVDTVQCRRNPPLACTSATPSLRLCRPPGPTNPWGGVWRLGAAAAPAGVLSGP